MSYTPGEAATACGIKKSTIPRAIKSGKVSATKAHCEWHIEPDECHRAYPPDRVLRERNERIEQWHRAAAQDPNVMLLGDPPFERSALAQSSASQVNLEPHCGRIVRAPEAISHWRPELLAPHPRFQHKGSSTDRRPR